MNIIFNNFQREYKLIKPEIDNAIQRVLESGWYILGSESERFEQNLSEYLNCKYVAGVANGTDAISIALLALGIGHGDEVITTSMTAYPTIVGIEAVGAKPVVVDIISSTGLIDPEKIKSKINSKTKAIIPVHLYGQVCDMDRIISIAKENGLKIVEDCAQSIGAKFKEKICGNFGDIGTLSFYPTKNLGAYGDAGAVMTNDKSLYEKILMLRNYGQSKKYFHDSFGYNSRLDEMQAAILSVKLKYLDKNIKRRREIAKKYDVGIKNFEKIVENKDCEHTYHLYVIKTDKREKLQKYLSDNGIVSLIHYPVPIHKQKGYKYQKEEELVNVEKFADQILSIPNYPELSDEEVEYIITTLNSF